MKLNQKKRKEMLINIMQSDNFTTRPIVLGNNTVECLTTYKLLGIIYQSWFKVEQAYWLHIETSLIESEFSKFTWKQ